MDWATIITLVTTTATCCLFFHRQTKTQIDRIEQRSAARDAEFLEESKKRDAESRDFHGRMCALEERYIQMMKGQEETRTLLLQRALER